MPAFMTALFFDCTPTLLFEFECTRQPGAVSNADCSRPIVFGDEGSSLSRHSGREPLILALALTRNCVADCTRMTGVYCFSMTTVTVMARKSTLTAVVTS